MVQKKYIIKSKKFIDNMTANIINNSGEVAKEDISLDEIIESTGGLVTDLQSEDRLYMETVVDGEADARATTVGAIVSKTMESVDELINAEKEIIYTWDVVNNGEDVDCSTIDASFNTIGFDRATHNYSLKIFNIESSNIRYFVFYGTYLNYTIQSKPYFSIDLFSCNCQFFAKDITTPFFEHKATAHNYIALDGKNLHLVQLRGCSSFIRFNNDLTQITEYFNTDEFFIPFSYDDTVITPLSKGSYLMNIWQPKTLTTGTVLSQVSFTYDSTARETIGESYLLQYPIHSACIVSVSVKDEFYTNIFSADLYGKLVFYDPKYGTVATTPANRVVIRGEKSFTTNELKNIISNFMVSGVVHKNADIAFLEQGVAYLGSATVDGLYAGSPYNYNSLGFYLDSDELHGLTNVSFFDKFDDPIPTGYTPTKNN